MNRSMDGDEIKSAAEVLERIRTRLKEQVRSGFSSETGTSQKGGTEQVRIERLRLLLEQIQASHSEVGTANPRPTGVVNDLIQAFKKALLRTLRWYTRSIIRYQATTTQFLRQSTDILERDQSRVQSLEAKVGLLADELADLRQRTLAKLDGIAQELEKMERKRS